MARRSIIKTCREVFGYRPRPEQLDIVKSVVRRGENVLAVLPTGFGKSTCYALPAVMAPKGHTAVVFSPLISLMKDQVDKFRKLGINAARISSDQDEDTNRKVLRAVAQGKVRILFVAPERLKNREFVDIATRMPVSLIAVDEAHCLSKWSRDFRPAYMEIGKFIDRHPRVPSMALTATADRDVEREVIRTLRLRRYKRLVASPRRDNLHYSATRDLSITRIPAMLRKAGDGGKLIYCSSRKSCENIADQLRHTGMAIATYHAGLDKDRRGAVQDRFIAGDIECVVATNAFGMGVDKPDIRLVLHYHMPGSIFDYVQEAGRAGRDGKLSRCVLNINGEGRRLRSFFINIGNPRLYVYERLWRYLCGKVKRGEAIRTTEQVLARVGGCPSNLEGWAWSALRFMEYNKMITVTPGGLTYRLPILNRGIAAIWARQPGVTLGGGLLRVTVQPGADNPVPQILRDGAARPEAPVTEVSIRRNTRDSKITQDMLDEKRLGDEEKVESLYAFVAAKDKAEFIDEQFLV